MIRMWSRTRKDALVLAVHIHSIGNVQQPAQETAAARF